MLHPPNLNMTARPFSKLVLGRRSFPSFWGPSAYFQGQKLDVSCREGQSFLCVFVSTEFPWTPGAVVYDYSAMVGSVFTEEIFTSHELYSYKVKVGDLIFVGTSPRWCLRYGTWSASSYINWWFTTIGKNCSSRLELGFESSWFCHNITNWCILFLYNGLKWLMPFQWMELAKPPHVSVMIWSRIQMNKIELRQTAI